MDKLYHHTGSETQSKKKKKSSCYLLQWFQLQEEPLQDSLAPTFQWTNYIGGHPASLLCYEEQSQVEIRKYKLIEKTRLTPELQTPHICWKGSTN